MGWVESIFESFLWKSWVIVLTAVVAGSGMPEVK